MTKRKKFFFLKIKYDKMEIAYEVDSKQVYAKGVLYYLLNEENHFFINLIE